MLQSPRAVLGRTYNNYFDYVENFDPDNPHSRYITVFSEPLAYFPYTYKRHWNGFVWSTKQVDNAGQLAWPQSVSIGYTMLPELSGEFLGGSVNYRFARLDREWAGMTANGSLVLNQSAQPFLAMDVTIRPFDWIIISSLTGVLEYHNAIGH